LSGQYVVQTPQNDVFVTNIPPEQLNSETIALANQVFQEQDKKFRQTLCELISSGHPIEAIKLYRERNRCSLKEAKDAIDALMEELRRSHPDQSQDSSTQGLFDSLKSVLSPEKMLRAIESLQEHSQKLEDIKNLSTEEII
jgi:ribosomal protein L7/L12